MLRSLIAVIIAVIAGLASARLVERVGAVLFGVPPITENLEVATSYQGVLVASWLAGAFVAALIALLIGRRWAPLGALGAASMLLSAVIALFSYPASWFMWPLALAVCVAGGYGAIKITGAHSARQSLVQKTGLFDE